MNRRVCRLACQLVCLWFALAAAASAQETANIARLARQCVVSPRLRTDVSTYGITWGKVRFERFTRLGTTGYYVQLCYPKLWMGKPAGAGRSAALYAGIWKLAKGKRIATLEHFVFQDQGHVEMPRPQRTPIGELWHLAAPCHCASKSHLDSYFVVREKQLRRLDTDSWEHTIPLPEGTARGSAAQIDLAAMEGRLPLVRGGDPAGSLRAKLRLDGLKLTADRPELLP